MPSARRSQDTATTSSGELQYDLAEMRQRVGPEDAELRGVVERDERRQFDAPG